jgi:hypothetical protein
VAYISDREKSFDSPLFVRALPNEYLVKVGREKLNISLGGTAFRPFTRHLKVPASSEITEFELECSTSNYLGVVVNGFVSWKIDPEHVETAIRSLDFYNIENPLEKTSGIIRDLARDAVRRSIAEIAVNDILTSGDQLKNSIGEILSDISKWGLLIESIGIRKIYIKSETVYNQLQAGERNEIRLKSQLSTQETEYQISQGQSEQQKKKQIQESELLEIKIREEIRQREMKQNAELARMRLEKQKEQEELALKRELELESFEGKLDELQHKRVLDAIRNDLAMKNLKVRERSRIVEGGLTDRELSEVVLQNLGNIGKMYRSSNITVFGDGKDAMASLIPPIKTISSLIRSAINGDKEPQASDEEQDFADDMALSDDELSSLVSSLNQKRSKRSGPSQSSGSGSGISNPAGMKNLEELESLDELEDYEDLGPAEDFE